MEDFTVIEAELKHLEGDKTATPAADHYAELSNLDLELPVKVRARNQSLQLELYFDQLCLWQTELPSQTWISLPVRYCDLHPSMRLSIEGWSLPLLKDGLVIQGLQRLGSHHAADEVG